MGSCYISGMIRVIFSVLLMVLFVQPALALGVTEVRVGQRDGGVSRLVLALDQGSEFRAFVLGEPHRLVIDLPDFEWHVNGIKTKQGSGIKEIRHGHLMDGVSRIVLDMDKGVAIEKAFVLSGPDRLVIDYKSSKWVPKKRFGTFSPQEKVESVVLVKPKPVANKPQAVAPSRPSNYKPLVVIDPGHGGVDPGAIGANGVHEKKVVLALAKELRRQLLASGNYRVKMTRETDKFVRLYDRVKFARRNEADLFVSVHADSVDKPEVQGASIYTLSNKASDRQSAKLAARENQSDLIAGIDLNVEDEEVAGILVDLAMRDTMNQSRYFANKISSTFKRTGVKTLKSPTRSAGFAVLKAHDIPSVLVEAGFMSNRAEANKLNTSAYRKKVAGSLMAGIDLYFEQVRKNERI